MDGPISGEVKATTTDAEGMILDFCELSAAVRERVVSRLDHTYINDIIPQPTAENISQWIWDQIEAPLSRSNCRLHEVWLWETATSCVVLSASDRTGRMGDRGQP